MTTPHQPTQAGHAIQQAGPVLSTYQFDQNGRPTQLSFQNNPQGANDHRYGPKQPPPRTPSQDPTIAYIAERTEECVMDLMQAFYDVSNYHDNQGNGPLFCTLGEPDAFPAVDVEATCRAVHRILIDHCRFGYSGHPDKDRLGFTRTGKKQKRIQLIDRDCDCYTRFVNVLNLIRTWKSVCADLVYSDTFIAGVVNAPVSIMNDRPVSKASNGNRLEKKRKADEIIQQHKTEQEGRRHKSAPTDPLAGYSDYSGYSYDGFPSSPGFAPDFGQPYYSTYNGGTFVGQATPSSQGQRSFSPQDLSKYIAGQYSLSNASNPAPLGHDGPTIPMTSGPMQRPLNSQPQLAAPIQDEAGAAGSINNGSHNHNLYKNNQFRIYLGADGKSFDPSSLKSFLPMPGVSNRVSFGNTITYHGEANQTGISMMQPPPLVPMPAPQAPVPSSSRPTGSKRARNASPGAATEPAPQRQKLDGNGMHERENTGGEDGFLGFEMPIDRDGSSFNGEMDTSGAADKGNIA